MGRKCPTQPTATSGGRLGTLNEDICGGLAATTAVPPGIWSAAVRRRGAEIRKNADAPRPWRSTSAGRYLTGRRSEATWRGRRYERRSRNPIPTGGIHAPFHSSGAISGRGIRVAGVQSDFDRGCANEPATRTYSSQPRLRRRCRRPARPLRDLRPGRPDRGDGRGLRGRQLDGPGDRPAVAPAAGDRHRPGGPWPHGAARHAPESRAERR